MPSNATIERVKTMRAYGAEVIFTPEEKTIEYGGALCCALQLAARFESGTKVLIVCARGDRYLSTDLFKKMNHD